MDSHDFLEVMHQELNIDLFKQYLKYSDSHVILKSKVNSSINLINECLSIERLLLPQDRQVLDECLPYINLSCCQLKRTLIAS